AEATNYETAMRNISFALTTEQFRKRTKTVTRRNGWKHLKQSDDHMGCVKCMGLKKGERVEKHGAIRVVSARREPLRRMLDDPGYGHAECHREGFPDMTPAEFVDFYCRANRCTPDEEVTRIEFAYH